MGLSLFTMIFNGFVLVFMVLCYLIYQCLKAKWLDYLDKPYQALFYKENISKVAIDHEKSLTKSIAYKKLGERNFAKFLRNLGKSRCGSFFGETLKYTRKRLLWDYYVRFFITQYMTIIMSILINYSDFRNKTSGEIYSKIMTIIGSVFVFLMPCYFWHLVNNHFNKFYQKPA